MMSGPTSWSDAPTEYSFSSLREIERCPRRWQYHHAVWGEFGRLPQRANERALLGSLIHALNESLFRAMADHGLPLPGTENFVTAIATVNVHATIATRLREIEAQYRDHPRDPGFRFRTSSREVANEALRLFRAQYVLLERAPRPSLPSPASHLSRGDQLAALVRRRVLVEAKVRHPTLSVSGRIDLLVRDGDCTRVVDLKTGDPKPEHRDQLLLYALLWWRATGDLPAEVEVAHADGRTRFPVDAEALAGVERELAERLEGAARALSAQGTQGRPGTACKQCPARGFCDAYWSVGGESAQPDERRARTDAEITVLGVPSAAGLVGRSAGGAVLDIVFGDEVGRRWGVFVPGERLRVVDCLRTEEGELRLTTGTEVYRVGGVA